MQNEGFLVGGKGQLLYAYTEHPRHKIRGVPTSRWSWSLHRWPTFSQVKIGDLYGSPDN